MPFQPPFTLILRCGKCCCNNQQQRQRQRQQADVFFLLLSTFFCIIIIFYVCWISYFCLLAPVAVIAIVVVAQLKLQCSLTVGVARLRQINFARVESPFESGKNASPSRNIINNCKRIPMARARCLWR